MIRGDTELLPGGLVDVFEFEEENAHAVKEGKSPCYSQACNFGNYQGFTGNGQLLVSSFLPGDNEGIDGRFN